MDTYDELLGADLTEHHIRHGQVGVSRAMSALRPFYHATADVQDIQHVGSNPGKHGTMNIGATLLKANQRRLVIVMCLYYIQQSNNFRVNNTYIKQKYIKMCLKECRTKINLLLLEHLFWGERKKPT